MSSITEPVTTPANTMTSNAEDSLKEPSIQYDEKELSDSKQSPPPDNQDDDEIDDVEEEGENQVEEKVDDEEIDDEPAPPALKPKKKSALKKKKRSASGLDEAEEARRANAPQPPLPVNADFYFMGLWISLVVVWGILWGGYGVLSSNSSFVILLTVNTCFIGLLSFYYWNIIRENARSFINLWWHTSEPVKKKMQGVIDIAISNVKQFFLLYCVVLVACGTGLAAFPAIALQGEWWSYVRDLPGNLMAIFILLVLALTSVLGFTSWLVWIIMQNNITLCRTIERNDYAILPPVSSIATDAH